MTSLHILKRKILQYNPHTISSRGLHLLWYILVLGLDFVLSLSICLCDLIIKCIGTISLAPRSQTSLVSADCAN